MTPDDVLAFWFADGPGEFRDAWFHLDPAFDAACRVRFGAALETALAGRLDDWAGTPAGALALAIVLDQLSRNIHRDAGEAFAGDAKGREVARAAIARGFDRRLGPMERLFLYLPFEHAEDPDDQDTSVKLFESLRGTHETANIAIESAQRHRDVIRRFGRFPHRNAVLNRESTPEEVEFLAEHGRGF